MKLDERAQLGCGPLSRDYDRALAYAAERHRFQRRKKSNIPYLTHLMSVSALVLENLGSEEQAIAGLLHDAIEDARDGEGPVVQREIRELFGDNVADIVIACSDGLDETGVRSGTWRERKDAYVAAIAHKSEGALLVTAADKLHNARCIVADLRTYGPEFMATFNGPADDILWYYESVVKALDKRGLDLPLMVALRETVAQMRRLVTSATQG